MSRRFDLFAIVDQILITTGLPNGFQFAGRPEDVGLALSQTSVSLKIGGYQLRPNWQDEIPNVVDNFFLQRESGVFDFPLLEKNAYLGAS
jgi:hypothetical protein